MNYGEIEGVVEDLVRIKSRKFAKGFLAQDDIAQEIRIKCYNSIDNFDPQKGQSIKTFLNICTENHLRNLIRDRFAKFDPPCRKRGCFHYDPMGRPTEDSIKCPEYLKYMEKYSRKCSVRMPCSIEESWTSSNDSFLTGGDIEASDLNMSIRDTLIAEFPDNYEVMITAYENMIKGKKVMKGVKIKIQKAVAKLLENQ